MEYKPCPVEVPSASPHDATRTSSSPKSVTKAAASPLSSRTKFLSFTSPPKRKAAESASPRLTRSCSGITDLWIPSQGIGRTRRFACNSPWPNPRRRRRNRLHYRPRPPQTPRMNPQLLRRKPSRWNQAKHSKQRHLLRNNRRLPKQDRLRKVRRASSRQKHHQRPRLLVPRAT